MQDIAHDTTDQPATLGISGLRRGFTGIAEAIASAIGTMPRSRGDCSKTSGGRWFR